MSPSSLHVDVLILPPVQLLDLAPVDLFHMLSKDYLQTITMLPAFVRDLAIPEVKIWYISPGPDRYQNADDTATTATATAPLTADARLTLTASLTDAQVQPGALDVLLIPGPDPRTVPSEAVKAFIRGHAGARTDIITVCTGVYPAARAGVLDGREVTGPRGLLGELRTMFPGARWREQRWTTSGGVDGRGELWTCAGITNGHDGVAAYIRAHFDTELADLVCALADIGDRGQSYSNGNVTENVWWLWLILRSFGRSWRNGPNH